MQVKVCSTDFKVVHLGRLERSQKVRGYVDIRSSRRKNSTEQPHFFLGHCWYSWGKLLDWTILSHEYSIEETKTLGLQLPSAWKMHLYRNLLAKVRRVLLVGIWPIVQDASSPINSCSLSWNELPENGRLHILHLKLPERHFPLGG